MKHVGRPGSPSPFIGTILYYTVEITKRKGKSMPNKHKLDKSGQISTILYKRGWDK